MKFINKIIFSLFLFCTFSACSLSDINFENNKGLSDSSTTVSINLNKNYSKTALPDISLEKMDAFVVIINDTDPSGDYYDYVYANSYKELADKKIPINTGTYNFDVVAYCNNIIYQDSQELTIVNGDNELNATLCMAGLMATSENGKGNLKIDVSYPKENVETIKAELINYNSNETVDSSIIKQKDGSFTYSINNILSGVYKAVFSFYAKDDVFIGEYIESCFIAENLTSTSQIEIESLYNVYSIKFYNTNFAVFPKDEKIPACYSRKSGYIKLPVIESNSEDYIFGGWYDNKNCQGSPVESFYSYDCENKEYYARWYKRIKISLDARDGEFINVENGCTVTHKVKEFYAYENSRYTLPTVSDLGLIVEEGSNSFRGWAKKADVVNPEFLDGATLAVSYKDLTLYAIYKFQDYDNKDTDGDGLTDQEEIANHMDPNSTDTDGDGWSDKEEWENYSKNQKAFDPRIADLPQIGVEMIGDPQICYNYSTSTSVSSSDSFSISKSESSSSSYSNSHGETASNTHGWKVSGGVTVKPTSFEWGINGEVNGSYTHGSSYNYSTSTSQSNSHSVSNGVVYTENEARTITGGSVRVNIKVTNPGNISYTLKSLGITLNRIATEDGSIIIPVSNTNNALPSGDITLAPGASTNISYSFEIKNPESVEKLVRNSSGLYINVSGWSIARTEGSFTSVDDFTNAMTRAQAKCARLSIDYGIKGSENHKPEVYMVSVKTNYNPNSMSIDDAYQPVSLRQLLETAGIYTAKNPDDPEFTSKTDPQLVLENNTIKSIRGVQNTGDRTRGEWYVMVQRKKINGYEKYLYNDYENDSDMDKTSGHWDLHGRKTYDVDNIFIYPQDYVSIFFDKDADGDGVPESVEYQLGTDDTKKDTDGDGLTDYEEIYGFERNGKICYTNPRVVDTDGDGLNDKEDPDPVSIICDKPLLNTFEYGSSVAYGNSFSEDSLKFNGTNYKKYLGILLGSYTDVLYAKINAKFAGSVIQYGFADDASNFNSVVYSNYEYGQPIVLKYTGDSSKYFVVKVTAPDKETVGYYYASYSSNYRPLNNLSIVSKKAGSVSLQWDTYNDRRFNGYLGYITDDDSKTISKIENRDISEAVKVSSVGTVPMDSFFVIDASSGTTSLNIDLSVSVVKVYLFGYNSSNINKIESYCLESGIQAIPLPDYGELKIYIHTVEAIDDCDGGACPEYFWTFSEDKMKSLEVQRDEVKKFDDNDEKFYDFDSRRTTEDCPSFDRSSKNVSVKLQRKDGAKYQLKWSATEKDYSSNDDFLGTRTLTMEYIKATDQWKCTLDVDPYTSSTSYNGKTYQNLTKTFNLRPQVSGVAGISDRLITTNMYTDHSAGELCLWFSMEWLRGDNNSY